MRYGVEDPERSDGLFRIGVTRYKNNENTEKGAIAH